jgi:hypothetical protein
MEKERPVQASLLTVCNNAHPSPANLQYGQAMMNRSVRRILKLGPPLWDLCVSSVGCFVFTSGFRSLVTENEGSEKGDSMPPPARKTLADVGAGLFLLAFITSEALATIRALGH